MNPLTSIPGNSIGVNIPPIPPQLPPTLETSSSAPSIPTSNMAVFLTKMEKILVAIYSPLNLPNPLSAMLTRYYKKYMPNFTGEGDFTAEEHLEAFYGYAKNINIEQGMCGLGFLCRV